jgi:hypothetical protein
MGRLDETIKLHPVFDGCKVYGPYYDESYNRYKVTIIYPNGVRKGILLSKFNWVNTTGVWPPDTMEVDHKNNNKLDDDFANLQLITKYDNLTRARANRIVAYVTLRCPWCESIFIRRAANCHISTVKTSTWTACSIECANIIRTTYRHMGKITFDGNIINQFSSNSLEYRGV